MDMKLHTTEPESIDMDSFEAETLKELNMPDEIVMRHRTPHFGHVFSGEGYATGYYGYLWADVLTCLLYTSPSPRDRQKSRMPSSA